MPTGPSVANLYREIRRFDGLLELARATPAASGDPTSHWSLESLLNSLLSRGRYPAERAFKVADYAMDLKFKVSCLATVDLPLYTAQLSSCDVESPRGRLVALSYDAALAFKCRSLWETVMNLTFFLEEGREAESLGAKKSRAWWAWARTSPRWRSLLTFKPLIARFDEILRTPEAHKASRLRSVFAQHRSPGVHRALAADLFNAAIQTWDQLAVVVALDRPVGYDSQRRVAHATERNAAKAHALRSGALIPVTRTVAVASELEGR
jgi:hypothetical protein